MDEVLFRSSQKLENLQMQLSLASSKSKELLQEYSQQSKAAALQILNSNYAVQTKHNIRELWHYLLSVGYRLEERFLYYCDPRRILNNLAMIFWRKWTKRDVYFLCAGFICGSIVGVIITLSVRKKNPVLHYMQAVQCTSYLGPESATVVETALAPTECMDNEVIVDVKAASVHIVDARICEGYGRTLRRILRKLYNGVKSEFPVTLGRDCTGIVTDVGQNVRRLEIGDEVWLTVPFWSDGTFSQTFLVNENRVGKKPKNVGYEGACSLPYAASLALNALKDAEISQENAKLKRVLIVGGCTPVGSVLIQILKQWNSKVTTTCFKRAVPVAKALGAAEIIVNPEPITLSDSLNAKSIGIQQEELTAFFKEIELKETFDSVIVTRETGLTFKQFRNCVQPDEGIIVSTLPDKCASDSYGFLGGVVMGLVIRTKYFLERLTGLSLNDFDEAHMCYVTLDEVANLVESGKLQTVVDKVFHPQDIEMALNHIQSPESIGSTILTFR